jgi:hypothetical protein
MTEIGAIDSTLAESQQNMIGLTEPDYDASPLVINMEQTLKLSIDLQIDSQAMSGDTLIWGYSTRGIWGTNKWGSSGSIGFILGSTTYGVIGTSQLGINSAGWVNRQSVINI